MRDLDDIFEDGYAAYLDGKDRRLDNPFDIVTDLLGWEAWREGWRSAERIED